MRLKPKSTVHNPRAVLYKRFTDLETATEKRTVYKTDFAGEIKYWVFDTAKYQFIPAPFEDNQYAKEVEVDEYAFYRYGDFVFRFIAEKQQDELVYAWERTKLSDVGENGEHEVEITFYLPDLNFNGYTRFGAHKSIKGILTKPVEQITVYQNSGFDFYDCFVVMNFGEKGYMFGDVYSPPQANVPSGTESDLFITRDINNNGLAQPYTMDIEFALVGSNDTADVNISVKFMATGLDLLSALFNDVARYQTNKYYRVGTFDYMIRGSIEGSENQIIKGAIAPLNSMEIKHFNDYIKLDHDDLVVIDGHLYYVEDTTRDEKRMPKKYNVYFARLNNIL